MADVVDKNFNRNRRLIKICFGIITVLFFLILSGFAWVISDVKDLSHTTQNLAVENSNRITEIQQSRLDSCKRTYNGVSEIFQPFFPANPETKEEKEFIHKFNMLIDKLVAGCEKQTHPIKTPAKSQSGDKNDGNR